MYLKKEHNKIASLWGLWWVVVVFCLFRPGFARADVQSVATISWQPVTHDTGGQTETEPIYYNIYCDTIPGFGPNNDNFLAATIDTEYVHTDSRLQDANTNLFYIVRAVDFWGNQSADSDTVGETGFVLARVKILLQSPYDAEGDSMSTALRDSGALPLQSPYPDAARLLTQMPEGVVDWIWLQLREAETGDVQAQKSFLLNKDGSVTELDGINQQLGFTGVDAGEYQLVVRHRNHVAVMARPLLSLDRDAAPLYDFTADSAAYYGTEAAKELETAVWGMWLGDIDQDGWVSSSDYDLWRQAAQQGNAAYQPEDLNFDGIITTKDYILWHRAKSAGAAGKVP